MGNEYFPCRECEQVWCDAGDYARCDICYEPSCEDCGSVWHKTSYREDDGTVTELRVCNECCTAPEPTETDVVNELIRMYRALPNADMSITCASDVHNRIKRHWGTKQSHYAKWKLENDHIKTESDADDSDDDDDDRPPAAKRACPAAEPAANE